MNNTDSLANDITDYWDDRSLGFYVATKKSLDAVNQKIELIIDELGLKPGLRVVDMGTGCGYMAILFAQRGFKVTGVDLVGSMVQYARDISKEKGLEIEFLQRDV
jgi:cyclopropane fatty-acyl-phospholipid synthase-like methyltransferase